MRRRPGEVRDAIVHVLEGRDASVSVQEITSEVIELIGDVPPSSVRSYLRLNTPALFSRMDRAQYVLSGFEEPRTAPKEVEPKSFTFGRASLFLDDCNAWMDRQPANSIHAVVTDPPYGLIEYSDLEQSKLREGKGGVWYVIPSVQPSATVSGGGGGGY